MTSTAQQNRARASRAIVVIVWVLRIALAALFLAAALMKLTSQPTMVAEFQKVGLGQWFRYFTGALEVSGAVLALVPRFSWLGALLLLCVDLGAFVAQVFVLHVDWVHPIVIGALLVALIWLQRARLPLPRPTALAG